MPRRMSAAACARAAVVTEAGPWTGRRNLEVEEDGEEEEVEVEEEEDVEEEEKAGGVKRNNQQ